MRHEPCTLDELSRHVLANLDGSKDNAALADMLQKLMATDVLQVRQGETTVRDPRSCAAWSIKRCRGRSTA